MSPPQLDVRRLSATYLLDEGTEAERRRLDHVLARVGERDLDQWVQETLNETGEWCIRRLDVDVRVRLDDSDAGIARQWASSLLAAVQRAIAGDGSADVVHYRSTRDALCELVCDVALGRSDRAWAWERVGVRSVSDPSPTSAPLDAILVALCRSAPDALAVIAGACERVGLATLDRTLGRDGWSAIVEIALAAVEGGHVRWVATADREGDDVSATPLYVSEGVGSRAGGRGATASASRRVAATLMSSSALYRHFSSSRRRPGPGRAWAWAVLAAIEADPGIARRPDADDVISAVAGALGRPSTTEARPGLRPSDADVDQIAAFDHDDGADPGCAALGDEHRPSRRPEPTTQDASAWPPPADAPAVSEWAGLLFLLNLAEAEDIVARILDDPVFADRTLRWVLHGIAVELAPMDADDPVALAFAGLCALASPPSRGAPVASAAEAEAIRALAHRWASAATVRLRLDDIDEEPAIEDVARRAAELVGEPGWVDVHLRMSDVDLRVRIAGLDLDPGWVPWLGSVVRFVYDH